MSGLMNNIIQMRKRVRRENREQIGSWEVARNRFLKILLKKALRKFSFELEENIVENCNEQLVEFNPCDSPS